LTKAQILNDIANNKLFTNICHRLCSGRYIKDDLYQEFFLIIAEKPESYLIDIYNKGYLNAYCVNTIYNLNYGKSKHDRYNLPSKFALYEELNLNDLDLNKAVIKDSKYNSKVDVTFDKVIKYLQEDDSIKYEDVCLLFESIDNRLIDISRESNIKYVTIQKKYYTLRDKIRKNVDY
jgi:DNA-directed RNA polymerase specialized sigma24 family protein